jgi:glyoxylase-like metal-dependent hydrolase (beta-lactamase superfamily II)
MRLGAFELFSLSDGFFGLDGGAMFGVVPKPVWERTNPPDERNRIRLALRPLLVVAGSERVLIDTGIGDKWDAKNTDIYRIEHTDTIESSLARAGFKPEDITKVVLTHLHFDHAGGATKLDSSGKPVPRFPNARYYVQRKEWDLALNPNRRSRAAYLPENFLPLQEAGQLEFIDGNSALVPGLELVLTGGHTPGHQVVVVTDSSESRNQKPEFRIRSSPLPSPHRGEGERSEGEEAVGGRRLADSGHRTAVFWGDLIPTRSHVATPYIMGYDLLPLETMEQKEKLVRQAIAGKWLSFLEHDPDFACGVIEEENGKPFLRPGAE